MATVVEEFVRAPEQKLLDQWTKNQLLQLVQHYKLMVDVRRTRETIQSVRLANLQDKGILGANDGKSLLATSGTGKTFEQQK